MVVAFLMQTISILSMTVKTKYVAVIQFVLLSIVPLKEEEHALCKINQSHNH